MDTRGLTSLEEGGAKKSQWSLWEQADKISGARQMSSLHLKMKMRICNLVRKRSAFTPLDPGGSVVPSIYHQRAHLANITDAKRGVYCKNNLVR